jgi:dihydroxyacetone kinase-like predicted kinase
LRTPRLIEPLQNKSKRPQIVFETDEQLKKKFTQYAGGHGGITSVMTQFVRRFVENRGRIATIPSKQITNPANIVLPLDTEVIEKLRVAVHPMTPEDFLEEVARATAFRTGSTVKITVPKNLAPMIYAFVSFMSERQTEPNKQTIQALLRDMFSRSEMDD